MDNRPVFYKDCFFKGITKVENLMDESCKFLSLKAFQSKYGLQASPLKFYGMITAINCLRRQIEETQDGYQSFHLQFLETPKPSRLVYKKLVSNKSEQPKLSQEKWHKEINIGPDKSITWEEAYELAFKCTKKLQAYSF